MGSKQSETNVWKGVQMALAPRGYRLFRNQRYKGQIVSRGKIVSGYVDAGVGGDGGHDLIGFKLVTICPEDVGRVVPVFCTIETKSKGGDKSKDQKTFMEGVLAAGGISGFAFSVEQALELFE